MKSNKSKKAQYRVNTWCFSIFISMFMVESIANQKQCHLKYLQSDILSYLFYWQGNCNLKGEQQKRLINPLNLIKNDYKYEQHL